jgi:broad specificity phosphatase PhoE
VLELVYETHSLSTDNEDRIATGWLPGALSDEGRRLARELGDRRRDVAAVFASDLGRAVETAELAFARSDVPVFLDWRLRECDYGELNGAHADEVASARLLHVLVPYPGGESLHDVVARMESFLHDVSARWDGLRICVVSHSANRWALQHLLEGRDLADVAAEPFAWREGWEFRVPRSAGA